MSARVNERSTKTEIWAEYKKLQEQLQVQPIAVTGDNARINELGAALETAKTDLLTMFETALKAADGAANDYVAAEQALAKRKAEITEELERSRAELQTAIEQARKDWEMSETDRKRARQHEDEEYVYELGKKRRAEEETFQAKWRAKFAELDSREAALKEQEERLKNLEQLAEKAPEELEKAVKEACDTLAKELNANHAAELKEARQEAGHQQSMLSLKLQTAELSIASKDKQLNELQKQLDNASAQLKDMAVTVIRASNTQNQPPAPSAN